MAAQLYVDSILNQPSFEAAFFQRIATRLHNSTVGLGVIIDASDRAFEAAPAAAGSLAPLSAPARA